MLYASSRDNLKKQLGYSYFTEDLYGSSAEDVTYQAYLDFKQRKIIDNSVMTATEIQSRSHATAELAVGVSKEYVHSVKFPMSVEATQKLKQIADGSVNLVQLVCKLSISILFNTRSLSIQQKKPSNWARQPRPTSMDCAAAFQLTNHVSPSTVGITATVVNPTTQLVLFN